METAATFFILFVVSLLGSTHCAVMCGGMFMTIPQRVSIYFHLARLWIYLSLGVLGAVVGLTAGIRSLGLAAGFITSLFFIISGISVILEIKSPILVRGEKILHKINSRMRVRLFQNKSDVLRALMSGGLSGLLPCGWLYLFVLGSVSLADPFKSPLLLFCFWLGTLPIFKVLRLVADNGFVFKFGKPASGALLVFLGLFLLISRTMQIGSHLLPHPQADSVETLLSGLTSKAIRPLDAPICGAKK